MSRAERAWLKYQPELHAFVKHRVANSQTADDILQDIFLKMHGGLTSLKDGKKLRSWLYQIARNAIADYFRRRDPVIAVPEWLPQAQTDPSEQAAFDLSACMWPMVRQLPAIYRETLILSDLKGLKHKEIAQVLGTSLSGVKSRVQRGRALLKVMLGECCRLELDHKGRLADYERQKDAHDFC